MTQEKKPHISVLLHEVLESFKDNTLNVFLDCTLGAGGHSKAILKAHPELQALLGIDQDETALSIAKETLSPWKEKIHFLKGNFDEAPSLIKKTPFKQVDGILLDLGVSSMQLDTPERGFSFMYDAPLDMRMDLSNKLTAAEIVNTWSEFEIARILRDYGEEKQWRAFARHIVQQRDQKEILTTQDLVQLLKPLCSWSKKKINPLTLVFQGLRIAVNRELDVLEQSLSDSLKLLTPGGRIAVISFHSLEDRIVKKFFRYQASDKEDSSGIGGVFRDKKPTMKIITRKPLIATEEEIELNPRSRSAKLRVAEKL